MEKTIEIPEGYEARIEGNKVILEPKESEDERIRKTLLRCCDDWEKGQFGCMAKEDVPAIRAYLEKQKEQKSIEDVIKNITKNKEAATKFLKSAGIMDDNGELAEMYRSEQNTAEWIEADKLHLNNAILVAKKEWGVNSYTARWLESLRDNYKKCNSHWKPSEEQNKAAEEYAQDEMMSGLAERAFKAGAEWRREQYGCIPAEEAYMRGFAQGAKEERKDLTPIINRLCEAILFEWKDAADLARKTLTQIKALEE